MKRLLFFIVTCLVIISDQKSLQAQNWRWAQRHGGDSIKSTGAWGLISAPFQDRFQGWNSVVDLATDEQNNIYAVSHILGDYADLNGLSLSGWGKSDILLSSYNCDGKLRWSKVIGSNKDSDIVVGVRCDETGVIVSGMTSSNFAYGSTGTHFSTDTVTGNTTKNFFVAKWHRDGTFQWLRMPQPDTISIQGVRQSLLYDMDATANGDTIFLFCYLAPGVYGGGLYPVSASGAYVLKYTNAGAFAGGVALPYHQLVHYGLTYSRWSYNQPLKQFVVSGFAFPGGTTTLNISGNQLRHSWGYLASFDAASGVLNYLVNDTGAYAISLPRKVAIDQNGDLYLSGNAKAGAPFNGVSFPNPLVIALPGGALKYGYAPFIMRLNGSTGVPVWTTKSQATSALGLNISLGKKGLLLTGSFMGTLRFPTASISNPTLDSGDAFTAFLDTATGAVRQLSAISAKRVLPLVFNTIVPDRKGSFICGGSFNDSLILGSTTLVEKAHPAGMDPFRVKFYDAWLGKFGYNNCNCNIAATYTAGTIYGTTGFFTYTGSTNIDSLVWNWGDGTKSTYTSKYTNTISHTYASMGRYSVCVTAYNDTCNNNQYCGTLPLTVSNLLSDKVSVYPNPATLDLHIEGLAGGSLRIVSVTGQTLLEAAIRDKQQSISIAQLPAGYYVILLRDKAGQSGQKYFVKK